MKHDMTSTIAEQRELAADLHTWKPNTYTMHPLTLLIIEFITDHESRMETLESLDLKTGPELAEELLAMAQRELVECVQGPRAEFIWGFAFYALHEVDWQEAATHIGRHLDSRAAARVLPSTS